jgi:hypothetical protein
VRSQRRDRAARRRARHLAGALLPAGVKTHRDATSPPATHAEFYTESKWCDACARYVRFLMSVNHSYCVQCGGRVRLFSRDDRTKFGETVQRHKWQAS